MNVVGSCLVCPGAVRALGTRPGGDYAVCSSCGTVQLATLPTPEALEQAYRESYRQSGHWCGEAEVDARRRANVDRALADLIVGLHPPDDPRFVVEIGAGWGSLGSELVKREIPYQGIEPSADMAEYARSKGLDVHSGFLHEVSLPSAIRTFVLVAVYEHLLDQEELLREMAARLDPEDGAILILSPTPGIPRLVGRLLSALRPRRPLPEMFSMLAPPWHTCLTSPQGLRLQAERNGLSVELVRPAPSGRDGGLRSVLQRAADVVARGGHGIFGERWPLVLSHVFVLRARP